MFKGKKTKKKFYEGKMKDLAYDMQHMDNGNFQKKYGKSKEELKKVLGNPPKEKPVSEAEINEDDLILVPGHGKKLKPGFIPHDKDRTDHEVEMARSDLFHAAKNAKDIYSLIKQVSEEEGLEGWVQEKIIKANDYLNTVREYLEHKTFMQEGAGVIAGGMSNFEESDSKPKFTYYAELKDVGFVKITASDANDAYNKAVQLWYPDEYEEIISNNSFRKKGLAVYMHNPGGEEYFVKKQKTKESKEHKCPKCGGPSYSEESIAEAKDACYHKVKSRYKVWPSAYASGALVKCRKVGASNWGNKSKK
jgi:hypothetical protein